jgi:hypothetical protein
MKENHPHPNPNQDGGKKENTNRHVYVEPGVKIDFVKDLREQHKTERHEDTTHNNRQLLWTKVGAGLVLIYAGLTFWQSCSNHQAATAAETSAKIATSTMQIDQRPWVYAKDDSSTDTIHMKAGDPLVAFVNIVNAGKTPAINVLANFYIEVVQNGSEPNYGNSGIHTKTEWGALIPDSPRKIRVERATQGSGQATTNPLLQSEEDSLTAGNSWTALYGTVQVLRRVQ